MTAGRRAKAAAAGGVLLSLCSCTAVGARGDDIPPNPLHGVTFYVNAESHPAVQRKDWQQQGKKDLARRILPLASAPAAVWLTGSSSTAYAEARKHAARAQREGQVPVFVAYNLPGRDCGQYSAGGTGSDQEYQAWIGAVAAAIGQSRAVVILEPDAIAYTISSSSASASGGHCKDPHVHDHWRALLAQAVSVLKQQPKVSVYVDAGNATWIRDVPTLARALRESGIERADGFSLNVANFVPDAATVTYADKLRARLPVQHYVLDSSRNGKPATVNSAAPGPAWCNPPGARLGRLPTSDTRVAGLDAYLWIKQPGDSDGPCRPGAPAAGKWWPAAALELVKPAAG